ncbi:Uma2 family endonuclease [Leptolyngbya sp. FACHB-261]|uniref:Uma2 family endonuclease n=1 Tax=Leptolyngbya sp. FACHB-261 TaxID=2692806 RepID=UPI00168846B6|nr:Uma2 family endonuclease [Leptolyngbya sp. FACHB-261]MBD2103646.1 Uma2 family endonuclease [Leptolyngbya sp. FACHB-261]
MVVTPGHSVGQPLAQQAALTITWEKLPEDFPLEEEPVENTGQPLIAGALREALELAGYIKPEMLIASNFGLCSTVNGNLVIKAPDWVYVASVLPLTAHKDRRSYTPNLEGESPKVVMEFLSETEGGEYSVKRTFPLGKWFFYEQILQVPTYAIFDPATGLLEVYRLQAGRYEPQTADAEGRYWLAEMELFLGVWQGQKEERTGYWLRWWDEAGNLLLWAVEQVGQERQRVEQERQRAERLAEYLRAQGINPDELD